MTMLGLMLIFLKVQTEDFVYEKYHIYVRPKARWALDTLQRLGCNITLYTHATNDYGNFIVDNTFPPQLFTKRLYRADCVNVQRGGKDLLRMFPLAPLGSCVLVDDGAWNQVGTQHYYAMRPYI